MSNYFDYNDSDYVLSISNDTGIDSDGHMMKRISDTFAIDLETGEMHMVSSSNHYRSRYNEDDDY